MSHVAHLTRVKLVLRTPNVKLPSLTPPAYDLSYSPLRLFALSLLGRLMQWMIVWEVPLSSLAEVEAPVRGPH